MATKNTQRKPVPSAAKTSDARLVALTLKVDEKTYVRLCTLGATKRRTNQDILAEALREYLKRSGA